MSYLIHHSLVLVYQLSARFIHSLLHLIRIAQRYVLHLLHVKTSLLCRTAGAALFEADSLQGGATLLSSLLLPVSDLDDDQV